MAAVAETEGEMKPCEKEGHPPQQQQRQRSEVQRMDVAAAAAAAVAACFLTDVHSCDVASHMRRGRKINLVCVAAYFGGAKLCRVEDSHMCQRLWGGKVKGGVNKLS